MTQEHDEPGMTTPGRSDKFGLRIMTMLAVLILPGAALAASPPICRQLESELASLSRDLTDTAAIRQYERAIDTQEQQLALAQRQWNQADCDYGYPDDPGSACYAIGRSLDRMEANYDDLLRERARLGSSVDSRFERARLLRSLDEAGCSEQRPTTPPETIAVAPVERKPLASPQQDQIAPVEPEAGAAQSPAEVKPAAPNSSIVAVPEPAQTPSIAATPPPGQGRVVLPDDQADKAGDKELAKKEAPAVSAPAREMTPADRNVRVVGPTFLPDPEGALNLRSPGRKSDQ